MNGPSQDKSAEATRIADAAVDAWDEVAARLAPIIGEQGVSLLYKRSLYLTAAKFPGLAPFLEARAQAPPSDSPFSDLKRLLEREAPGQAGEASRAVFSTFTGLLGALIGEGLTTRLFAPVPIHDDPDESPKKVAQ